MDQRSAVASCSAAYPNPYARDSSRRAIACVSCAKAKTRCDKSLPSCSRCTSKGLKCDPRSTRRTSENNYRSVSTRKPLVSPKRFPTPSTLPSSAFSPPRSTPTRPRGVMRAPSHIDFRTAVKMSQQAAMSGAPKLTPLPTYQRQVVDECYSYTSTPEPDLRFTPDMDEGFPFPPTPGGFAYREERYNGLPYDPLEYLDCTPWDSGSPWSNTSTPIGLGLDMSAPELWTPEPESHISTYTSALSISQTPSFPLKAETHSARPPHAARPPYITHWPTPSLSPHVEAVDLAMDAGDSTESTTLQRSIESDSSAVMQSDTVLQSDMDSGIVMQAEWPQQDGWVDMSRLVCAAYVPKRAGGCGSAGTGAVWEDVFVAGLRY